MNTPKTIKVLKGISTAACAAGERKLLKPLETLFYIKSIWMDRPIPFDTLRESSTAWGQITNEARVTLTKISKRCARTNKRRIEHLIELGFLRRAADGLHAISWAELCQRYNIEHQRFYHIKPTEHVQLEYIVKAKVLSEKKLNCEFGYKAHLKSEPYLAEIIEKVSGSLRSEAVAKHQLDNFLTEGLIFDEEQQFALSMRYVKRSDTHLNGDLEINYKTGTKIFGYPTYGPKSKCKAGSYAKLKKSLERMGVIVVHKRRTPITRGTNTTLRKRKVRLGFVKYEKALGEAFLIQPDRIEIVPTSHVDERYKQMQALEATYKNLLKRTGS